MCAPPPPTSSTERPWHGILKPEERTGARRRPGSFPWYARVRVDRIVQARRYLRDANARAWTCRGLTASPQRPPRTPGRTEPPITDWRRPSPRWDRGNRPPRERYRLPYPSPHSFERLPAMRGFVVYVPADTIGDRPPCAHGCQQEDIAALGHGHLRFGRIPRSPGCR